MKESTSQRWGANTEHGMLVALGEFLNQHGLLDELMKVPIAQRAREFVPQTKLVEFLAAIMSGSERLEDISSVAHPLRNDQVVAQGWGQPGWAHYSTVSRTLDACNKTTVAAVERAVQGFSRPFIAKAMLRTRLSADTAWVRVGDNAEMTAWADYLLYDCPYPVPVALERFKVVDTYKYATLIHYRDDGNMPTLPAWFRHYNQRQTIEAGNKELKGTFVQHLMNRSLLAFSSKLFSLV